MRQCLAKRPLFYRIGMVRFPRNLSDPNCVGILLEGGTELTGGHAVILISLTLQGSQRHTTVTMW